MAKIKYFFRRLKITAQQLVCDHEYVRERVPGFHVKDGWLVQVYQCRCIKCGKVKRADK